MLKGPPPEIVVTETAQGYADSPQPQSGLAFSYVGLNATPMTPEDLQSPNGSNSNNNHNVRFESVAYSVASGRRPQNLLKEPTSSATLSRSSSVRTQIGSFFEVSDNRLAMKLFGNRRALDKEKERQQKTATWLIHPCSKFRFYWDLIMLLLLLSNMVLLPLAIAFFSEDFMEPGWLAFNCLSDTIFIVDIIINFRTGVIGSEPGSEVTLDPREIAIYYLKSWFVVDFISSIPVDYIFIFIIFVDGQPMHHNASLLHAGRAFRIMRLAKFMGLLRLLRLSRLVRYINEWQEFLNVATMVLRISNLVGLTVLLAHWNGCLQFLVPMMQGFPEDSWVAKRGIQEAPVVRQYTMAIFRALSHMLSIGYGQDVPDTTAEVWLTVFSMLTGATVHAVFLGHMTNLIHSYDSSRRMYTEKSKQVQEYMFYRKLPRNLRDRITDYYEHRFQGKMFDESSIMAEISDSLREDVIGYNCRVLIQRVPFFENAESSFLSDVLTKLKPELFQPNDFIIKEGTIGKRMYFIQDGAVDIIKNNEIATTLTEGSYFGEISLLASTKRCASVKAVTYCQLFSLGKEDFDEVLRHYPMMKRTMKGIAVQRLYKIGENPRLVSRSEDLAQDLNAAVEILKEPLGLTAVTRPAPELDAIISPPFSPSERHHNSLSASYSQNYIRRSVTPSTLTSKSFNSVEEKSFQIKGAGSHVNLLASSPDQRPLLRSTSSNVVITTDRDRSNSDIVPQKTRRIDSTIKFQIDDHELLNNNDTGDVQYDYQPQDISGDLRFQPETNEDAFER